MAEASAQRGPLVIDDRVPQYGDPAAPESPEVHRIAEALAVALDRVVGIGTIGKPHKRSAISLDSDSWREWEERKGGDSSQAQTITKDIVQGDIKRATGISLVNVEDHPNSIRAARKVGEVIRRMKAQGYKVPTALSVGRAMTPTARGTMTTARINGTVSYTDIVIDIPENAPDDMPLDDMVGKAFGGTTEDGTPNYTVRTFEDIVVHEMGHLQHRIALGNEQVSFDKLEKQGWPKIRLIGEAGKSVSMYALHDAYEFIAEAFTKLYRGEPLSASAEAVYRELNGPKVVTT